jgi:hypothetical protein
MSFVVVRFDDSDKELLRRICKDRREHLSTFVRRAVIKEIRELSYGTQEEKKALGIPHEGAAQSRIATTRHNARGLQ